MRTHETFLGFLKRNERPLATALFIIGFVTDLITFGFLDIPLVTILFGVYLIAVAAITVIAHITYGKGGGVFTRFVSVVAPLIAQFLFGSLLSGFVIFYTKSAVLSVSWPFILLLLAIFFGNEIFRNYRDHLIFQTLLFYFSLYAFAVFALPLLVGHIGTTTFLWSTAITVVTFGLYLSILGYLGWIRLRSSLGTIIASVSVITMVVVASYIGGLLPPIPLTLKAGGVYHNITHSDGIYTAQTEGTHAWYDPRKEVVHNLPGSPLYAYSAIFAPGEFSTSIVHVWQRYDNTSKKWQTRSVVAFSLSGGRAGGYRGYSLVSDPEAGEWRVLVQTLNGQTIGKLSFEVESVSVAPALTAQNL